MHIQLYHCVLLPSLTSVYLVTSETPHNYIYVTKLLKFSLHHSCIKFRGKGFAQNVLKKMLVMQSNILAFISWSLLYGMDRNGTEQFCHIISQNRVTHYFRDWHSIPPCALNCFYLLGVLLAFDGNCILVEM